MKDDTPAAHIDPADLERNAQAFRVLINHLHPSHVKNIVDVRYGLGTWARIALDKFPANVVGFESDYRTAEKAWRDDKRVSLFNVRFDQLALDAVAVSGPTDLLVADFNFTTRRRRGELDWMAAGLNPRYLVFTDVACGKLHLNYRTYGLAVPSLEEYWASFVIEGYQLLHFAHEHRHASTGLYERRVER